MLLPQQAGRIRAAAGTLPPKTQGLRLLLQGSKRSYIPNRNGTFLL
jgi:hypothetical protein